jgi:3-deoxy-D-manno-octulosonic-acid transferase
MTNFREMVEALIEAGAARTVADEAALADAAGRLIGEDGARRAAAEAGERVAAGEAGVIERVLAAIAPHLPPAPESETTVARA